MPIQHFVSSLNHAGSKETCEAVPQFSRRRVEGVGRVFVDLLAAKPPCSSKCARSQNYFPVWINSQSCPQIRGCTKEEQCRETARWSRTRKRQRSFLIEENTSVPSVILYWQYFPKRSICKQITVFYFLTLTCLNY